MQIAGGLTGRIFYTLFHLRCQHYFLSELTARLLASDESIQLRERVKKPTRPAKKGGIRRGTFFDDPKQKGCRLCSRQPCFS
jgi:hypothetical protein